MPRILLIPDRFTDHRMWGGMPARLARRAELSHLDQLITLPRAEAADCLLRPARGLSPGGWDVVAAAARSCPLGVTLAAAGLARSLMLVQPEIPYDRIPDEIDLGPDWPVDTAPEPYETLIADLHDATAEQWTALLAATIRQTADPAAPGDELDLAVQLAVDHAAEVRAELQAAEAAWIAERYEPAGSPQPWRPERGAWLDQLADLTVPVVTVVPRRDSYLLEAVPALRRSFPPVLTQEGVVPPGSEASRETAAAAIERLLDWLTPPG